MGLIEAVSSRKSIRGYRPDMVPQKVLAEILEMASRAPSSMNTQPWKYTVVAGEVLEKIMGSCIQMQGLMFPDVIRKFTGIPESQRMSICLTIGYPVWDFPANKVRSEREPINNLVSWCGW